MEFGEAVRLRRKQLDMTLADLSARSGTSRAMLSEIELGRKNPTLGVACSIATALGCQISDLLDVAPDVRFRKLDEEHRRVLVDPKTGVERHLLAPPMVQHGIQVLLYVFPPGQTARFTADGTGVIEHISCLTGRVRVELFDPRGHESADLRSGECVNYMPWTEHAITNLLEEQESRAMVVIDMTRRGEPKPFEDGKQIA